MNPQPFEELQRGLQLLPTPERAGLSAKFNEVHAEIDAKGFEETHTQPYAVRKKIVTLYRATIKGLRALALSALPSDEKRKIRAIREAILAERKKVMSLFPAQPIKTSAESLPKSETKPKKQNAELEKTLLEFLGSSPVPIAERQAFLNHYSTVPEHLKSRYLSPVIHILKGKNPVHVFINFRAYLFELSQRALFIDEGLENIDETIHEPMIVPYHAYEKEDMRFIDQPQRLLGGNPKGNIEADIEWIMRDGKPYIFESKCMAIKTLGRDYGRQEAVKARNQLLKYQAAIDQGKASGATLEVRGMFDEAFFEWLLRPDTCPDVEVIFNMPDPQGLCQRFVVKHGSGTGLRFKQTDLMKSLNAQTIDDAKNLKPLVSYPESYTGILGSINDDDLELFLNNEKREQNELWKRVQGFFKEK